MGVRVDVARAPPGTAVTPACGRPRDVDLRLGEGRAAARGAQREGLAPAERQGGAAGGEPHPAVAAARRPLGGGRGVGGARAVGGEEQPGPVDQQVGAEGGRPEPDRLTGAGERVAAARHRIAGGGHGRALRDGPHGGQPGVAQAALAGDVRRSVLRLPGRGRVLGGRRDLPATREGVLGGRVGVVVAVPVTEQLGRPRRVVGRLQGARPGPAFPRQDERRDEQDDRDQHCVSEVLGPLGWGGCHVIPPVGPVNEQLGGFVTESWLSVA